MNAAESIARAVAAPAALGGVLFKEDILIEMSGVLTGPNLNDTIRRGHIICRR
jgi:hypothetical protein